MTNKSETAKTFSEVISLLQENLGREERLNTFLEYAGKLYMPENHALYADVDERGGYILKNPEDDIPGYLPKNPQMLSMGFAAPAFGLMSQICSELAKESKEEPFEILDLPDLEKLLRKVSRMNFGECAQFLMYYHRAGMRFAPGYFYLRWKDGSVLKVVQHMQDLLNGVKDKADESGDDRITGIQAETVYGQPTEEFLAEFQQAFTPERVISMLGPSLYYYAMDGSSSGRKKLTQEHMKKMQLYKDAYEAMYEDFEDYAYDLWELFDEPDYASGKELIKELGIEYIPEIASYKSAASLDKLTAENAAIIIRQLIEEGEEKGIPAGLLNCVNGNIYRVLGLIIEKCCTGIEDK